MAAKKTRITNLTLYSGAEVTIYAGARVQAALADVTENMTLYKGVKLSQLLEAVYDQGKKDGARAAFEKISDSLTQAEKQIPHRTPGRPRVRGSVRRLSRNAPMPASFHNWLRASADQFGSWQRSRSNRVVVRCSVSRVTGLDELVRHSL